MDAYFYILIPLHTINCYCYYYCQTLIIPQKLLQKQKQQELEVCEKESSDGSESIIYKQVGPVLIKNDLEEAKETVTKRLEFIEGEM